MRKGNETMTAATAEANEHRVSVEEQVRIVAGLLKEYASKLAALNVDFLVGIERGYSYSKMAWLLDQGELLRPPLTRLMSRGSALLEHSSLGTITEDELTQRMREMEIHFHHALRLTHELRKSIDKSSRKAAAVAKLRVSAGLNAMKGGPLRPE
jgi:hypothetical protein